MKRKVLLIILILVMTKTYSQNVEKIGQINSIKSIAGIAGGPGSPNEIAVNEAKGILKIVNKNCEYTYFSLDLLEGINKENYRSSYANVQIELRNFKIDYDVGIICIENKDNSIIKEIAGTKKTRSGISFILKKGSGYIVYFVDGKGIPGAVDTEGKIYSNKEAVEYLKQYDSEKYEESLLRAEELGLKEKFLNNEVLVWGQTYYKPVSYLLQYDESGLSYSFDCAGKWGTFVGCHLNDEEIMSMDNLNDFTSLVGIGKGYSTSWYVGFGGNIYYYISGEEYTEVFRIRRTWGNPDFYAMAVNGYTEDEYGNYVNEVLLKLSKAELRLLRNTVFALYGVHFKSDDLAKHFDKQVWYTDEGKSSAEVTLPVHRQKLVEMILALEK